MTRRQRNLLALFSLLAITSSTAVAATEFILSAPPREDRAVAANTYGPLAKFLSEQLGQPVVYRQPESWAAYSAALRKGEYDFVFDGPHFAAWRMVHLQHQPLAKLPGAMSFVVVTATANTQFTKLGHLRSATLCGMASPNLATNAVLAEFGPVASPNIFIAEGNAGIVKAFESGSCDGMILRDSFYNKLPEEKRAHLKVLFTTQAFANQTLTSGPRVSAEQYAKLSAALLGESGSVACGEIISRFGDKSATSMVAANPREFQGNNLLLEGVVWGW